MSDLNVDYGAPVIFEADFKNSSGAAADPTTVFLRLYLPPGQSSGYVDYPSSSMSSGGTGNFTITITMKWLGEVTWAWFGTGSVVAQTRGTIMVGGFAP